MATPISTVTPYAGQTPAKEQDDTVFDTNIDDELAYINVLPVQLNTTIGELNTFGSEMEALGAEVEADRSEVANNTSLTLGYRNEAEGFRDEAAAIAGTLPEGTINDTVTTLTDTWSSQKISDEIAASGGLIPILTVNASAVSSIEFTDLDTYPYKSFVLQCSDLDVASNAAIYARISTDNGVSYDSTSGDYSYVGLQTQILSGGASSSSTGVYSADLMYLGFARPESHTFLNVSISALNEYLTLISKTAANGSDRLTNFEYTSSRRATQLNNAIQIYLSSGTITGTFTLYGVAEA